MGDVKAEIGRIEREWRKADSEWHAQLEEVKRALAAAEARQRTRLAALEDFVRDVAEEPFYGGTPECSDRARALMNNEEGDRAGRE
jgi:hypothetical protein